MTVSEKTQHAIRRSTRLPLQIPVLVTSLHPDHPFSEPCTTSLVNAHGCGLVSPRPMHQGARIRIEITSAKRHTSGQITAVVPLGGDPETWLLGVALDVPGNFWGIEYAPPDWTIQEPSAIAPSVALTPDKPARPGPRWRLSDISAGACYIESLAPFPVSTPVLVSVRTLRQEFLLDGVVRISHPQTGMGIEFAPAQSDRVEQLIAQLTASREVPRVFVGRREKVPAATPAARPQGSMPVQIPRSPATGATRPRPSTPDPLLDLIREGPSLSPQQFLDDLREQRLGKRRDPRVYTSLPILLTGVDAGGRPLSQQVMTVNISRSGALLEGIHSVLSPGDTVSLTLHGREEKFRVAWVVDEPTRPGACIGVSAQDPASTFWDAVIEADRQQSEALEADE